MCNEWEILISKEFDCFESKHDLNSIIFITKNILEIEKYHGIGFGYEDFIRSISNLYVR